MTKSRCSLHLKWSHNFLWAHMDFKNLLQARRLCQVNLAQRMPKKKNTHNFACFQRKSLIKTVEKELLKSCKTKWRQAVPFFNAIYLPLHTREHSHICCNQAIVWTRVCVRVFSIPYIISLPFVAVIRLLKMKIISVTSVGHFPAYHVSRSPVNK